MQSRAEMHNTCIKHSKYTASVNYSLVSPVFPGDQQLFVQLAVPWVESHYEAPRFVCQKFTEQIGSEICGKSCALLWILNISIRRCRKRQGSVINLYTPKACQNKDKKCNCQQKQYTFQCFFSKISIFAQNKTHFHFICNKLQGTQGFWTCIFSDK